MINRKWTQKIIQQRYIDAQTEESLNLDYKAAAALDKNDQKKKTEITKDVSAMANSDGGIVIYGVAEYNDPNKKHLPEKIDPIDQKQFSKERLEQVINNIRPRISGIVIHPVHINSVLNGVIYVVEIPKGTTAHQAQDYRYYKRFNFESVPMEDYEVRDVMSRAVTPDAHIEFGLYIWDEGRHPNDMYYRLRIVVKNQGIQVINRFKVIVTLTNVCYLDGDAEDINVRDLHELEIDEAKNVEYGYSTDNFYDYHLEISYQSKEVLFPREEIDIGKEIKWVYHGSYEGTDLVSIGMWGKYAKEQNWMLKWTLYADNMRRKEGVVPIHELPQR